MINFTTPTPTRQQLTTLLSEVEPFKSSNGIRTILVDYVHEAWLNVTFCPLLKEPSDIAGAFNGLRDVRIILWFISYKGLRQDWLDYLIGNIVNPIRALNINPHFVLYNLQCWQGLKDKEANPDKPRGNRVVSYVTKLQSPDITCLDAAEYFQTLTDTTSVSTSKRLEAVWRRPYIWHKTMDKASAGRTLGKALGRENSNIAAIRDRDVAAAYPALQWDEGTWLAERVASLNLRETRSSGQPLPIVFLLPNDEPEYYSDPNGGFLEDTSSRFQLTAQSKDCQIRFIPFPWNKGVRPYLSDGKPIKLPELDRLKAK